MSTNGAATAAEGSLRRALSLGATEDDVAAPLAESLLAQGKYDEALAVTGDPATRRESLRLPPTLLAAEALRDNEDGLLIWNDPESDILVEHSVFARNGHGDGQSHNICIGRVRSFTLRFSHSHDSRIGHEVKSRAAVNNVVTGAPVALDIGAREFCGW